jgi:methyltransferase (TIGR00027 family)
MARAGQKPNFSAETVAAARDSAATRYPPPVGNPDYLAKEFLGPRWRLVRALPPLHAAAVRAWERRAPGVYHYMNARTHHIDRVAREEAAGGVGQMAILGAGYDTRAYRLPELREARVFEVDLEPTQARKREVLHRVLGEVPPNVSHVVADLELEDPFEPLEQAGFDPSRRCCFVCEGLTYYLTEAGAEKLFATVARRAAAGSSIVFDYLYREALDGNGGGYPGALEVIRYLEKRGQPYRFGIPEDGLAEWLAPLGLTVVSDLSPAEMQDRYLRAADGAPVGTAYAAYGMGWARSRPPQSC